MVSTSSKRDSMFRAIHFVILMMLLFRFVVSDDTLWQQSCSSCYCHWNSGKKAADCKNLSMTTIPKDLSSDLQYVDFSHNIIPEIQQNQFSESNLPNLHKLFMRNCTMLEVNRDSFLGLKVLIELDLSNNQIRLLHAGTFNDLEKLRKVMLNNNELEFLPPHLFKNLTFLRQIEFKHNRIATIATDTFVNLNALTVIELASNRLTVLKSETFENLKKLKGLSLEENPWNCSCQLAQFRDFAIRNRLYTQPTNCHAPPLLLGKLWTDVESDHFACRPEIIQPNKRIRGGPSGTYVEASAENVTLTCRMRASPQPKIFWMYNKRPINLSDRRLLVLNAIETNRGDDLDIYVSELTIIGVRPNDKGSYICQAENHGGKDEAELQLAVGISRIDRTGMEDVTSDLFLITCVVVIVLLILLLGVILALCLYCRRVRRYTKDTSMSENGLMTSKLDKTQNGSMLEGSVITEMQKSLLTEVNPVEKPPRRTTDIESLDMMDDGHDIKKTLLDETPFGSHDEETNSVALSDTTPRSRQTFVDDGYGTNLPPDLLSFQARVPQSPSLQSSMSNIPDSRLYGKSPLASPVYQHVINHPSSTPNNGIYGVNPAAFRTLQHPKNRNLALVNGTRSNNSSPFIPAPIVYPPVVMKQGYMTIPRKPRVPSWTPSCSTTLSEFQPSSTTAGSILNDTVEPVYDNLGLRTTAGGNSSLNLTKIGTASASGQQPSQSAAAASRYTMKDRPLPATPSLSSGTNGTPNRIYEPIQEMANLTTMTSDTEPLYGTAKHGHGVTIVPSNGGTLDKLSKIPPRPPPKPKKKISVTSNGQGSTSQLFEDEGEDGTEV